MLLKFNVALFDLVVASSARMTAECARHGNVILASTNRLSDLGDKTIMTVIPM